MNLVTRFVPRRGFSTSQSKHPKLLLKKQKNGVFSASKENLNTVFKPGSFGGQLMAHALSAAMQTNKDDKPLIPISQNSTFLAPVLLSADVKYSVSTVRESGKTFLTKRVRGFQGDDDSGDTAFESTISFYSPSETQDDKNHTSKAASLPSHLQFSLENSISLNQLQAQIKDGEIKRGKLYQMALMLASNLSEKDMRMTIRLPIDDGFEASSGQTRFFVGVDEKLAGRWGGGSCESFSDVVLAENARRLILPYVSDGMTQVSENKLLRLQVIL